MQGLVRKSAVQYGLVVVLLVALTYGVLAPAGSARATGQLVSGANGTPVVAGTPIAPSPTPPAPPEPARAAPTEATASAIPTPSSPDESVPASSPAPSNTSASPATATPAVPAPATPQAATPTFAARPARPGTPVATPTATPVVSAPAAPTGTAPAASPTPTVRFAPTATPTRLPSGSVSASIVRDLSPLSFTLNGRDQVARATLEIEVSDPAPPARQPGWSLSLSVEQLRVAGNASRALPTDAVTLLGVTVECVGEAACTAPENTIAYPITMPAGTAVEIVTAAPGSGAGRFIVTPIFAVRVPATAYAGSYTTAIAIDIAGGAPVLAVQAQGALPATVTPLPTGTTMATPTPLALPPAPATPEQLQASLTTPPSASPAPPGPPEPISEPEPETTPEPVAPAPTPSATVVFPATDRIGTTQAVNLRTDPAATGATRLVAGVLWRHFTLADGRTGWVRDLDVLPVAR